MEHLSDRQRVVRMTSLPQVLRRHDGSARVINLTGRPSAQTPYQHHQDHQQQPLQHQHHQQQHHTSHEQRATPTYSTTPTLPAGPSPEEWQLHFKDIYSQLQTFAKQLDSISRTIVEQKPSPPPPAPAPVQAPSSRRAPVQQPIFTQPPAPQPGPQAVPRLAAKPHTKPTRRPTPQPEPESPTTTTLLEEFEDPLADVSMASREYVYKHILT